MNEYQRDLALELFEANKEGLENELQYPNPDGSTDFLHLQTELEATNSLITEFRATP